MPKGTAIRRIGEIEFSIIYSGRRSLGISILPDSSVIVRVPFKTPDASIERIVKKKYNWIIKHRDNFLRQKDERSSRLFINGERHLFRGNELFLTIEKSERSWIRFNDGKIEMGIDDPGNQSAVRDLLRKGYREEAGKLFPLMMRKALERYSNQGFKPSALALRTMKRRWGSCSGSGKITLSTELVKLSDIYIEYVIAHELCHLKQHNHGDKFYRLLSEVFPEWKKFRYEMRHMNL